MGGLGIYDPWDILHPAGIASRIKAFQTNVVALPYSAIDKDFHLFFPPGTPSHGMDDVKEWWNTIAPGTPIILPENCQWGDQHYLFKLQMTSLACSYDDSVDLRARRWRTLFKGPCSNAWVLWKAWLMQSGIGQKAALWASAY